MAWVRLDDEFYNHPKLPALGAYMLPCVAMHVLALCYSNCYLTDGKVPKNQLPRLIGDTRLLLPEEDAAKALASRLVDVKMWHDRGSHYLIHDYLKYNPSRAEVMELRRKKAEAGQAGGLARAKHVLKQTPSKREANAKQNPTPNPNPNPNPKEKEKTPPPTSPTKATDRPDDLSITGGSDRPERTSRGGPEAVAAILARLHQDRLRQEVDR